MEDIIVYENGELELKVSVNSETVWLNQKQLSGLFDKDTRTINEHIKNIYKDEELDKNLTVRKFRIVQQEGNRQVSRNIEHYNLDMIISIGYKVNSKKATKFRQWATKVLKSYILDGYVINSNKITNDRFVSLEKDVTILKDAVKTLVSKNITPSQGIFYNGQIYDAYAFINDILKSAKSSITLIDNYIDDSVLTLFSKYPKVKFKIIISNISKQLKLDINKYNSQYNKLEISINKTYHDRFIIIDDKELYHIGASLKDLGKKVFAFNKMDIKSLVE